MGLRYISLLVYGKTADGTKSDARIQAWLSCNTRSNVTVINIPLAVRSPRECSHNRYDGETYADCHVFSCTAGTQILIAGMMKSLRYEAAALQFMESTSLAFVVSLTCFIKDVAASEIQSCPRQSGT